MRTPWMLLVALGCAGGSNGDKPGVVGEPPTDTGEEPTTHDGFQPYAFAVVASQFALDPATLQVTGATTLDGGGLPVELPISLTILVTDVTGAETSDFTDENHCTVQLTHPGPLPYAAWTGEAGAWSGFEIDTSVGTTDCGRLDFPPSWGDNPVDQVTKWVWGAGVNPITDATLELLGPGWESLEPVLVGAGYHWQNLAAFPASDNQPEYEDGYLDVGFGYAWRIDESGLLVTDGAGEPVAVTVDEVAASGDGARAWYDLQMLRLLYPASILLDEP